MTMNGQPSLSPGKGVVNADAPHGTATGAAGSRRSMAIKEGADDQTPQRPRMRVGLVVVIVVPIVLALIFVLAVAPLIAHSPPPHQ